MNARWDRWWSSDAGRDGAFAFIIGLLTLVLYGSTLCPTVYWYDSAEYAAAAATLGIAHPPGHPLYVLTGYVLTTLVPAEPALVVNAMTAFFGALAVALSYLVSRQLGAGRAASAIAALALGATPVLWSNSVVTEVYSPALAVFFGVVILVLRGVRAGSGRLLIGAAALAGLGLGFHLSIASAGLGLAWLVWGVGVPDRARPSLRDWLGPAGLRRRLKIAGASAVATVGTAAAVYSYLPIRAATKPKMLVVNVAELDTLLWYLSGGVYKTWFARKETLSERASLISSIFYEQFLVVGAVLVVVGLVALYRWRPHRAVGVTLMVVGNVAFFFRYEVHDLAVFFLPAIGILFCVLAVGLEALFQGVRSVAAARGPALARTVQAVMFLFPLSSVVSSYDQVDRSEDTAAKEFGEMLVRELPPDAIIINFTTPPEWVKDTVFQHYYQKVLDRRQDVRVVPWPPFPRLVKWVQSGAPVYAYVPHNLPRKFKLEPEAGLYRLTEVRQEVLRDLQRRAAEGADGAREPPER
jgi:hypothetical protein